MSVDTEMKLHDKEIDLSRDRFPYSIVWTPLPCITWLIPPIGHMGIAYSTGIIRDFAGPYFVSEDNLAFGKTTRYLQLDPTKIKGTSGSMRHFRFNLMSTFRPRMGLRSS